MESWRDGLTKGVVGLVTGGGTLTAVKSQFFGSLAFQAFSKSLGDVYFQNSDHLDYSVWNVVFLLQALPLEVGLGAAVSFAALLVLIAHVAFKASRKAPEAPKNGRWRALLELYVRRYFLITNVAFLALLVGLWSSLDGKRLVALCLLIVLPGVLYLVLYSRDLLQGTFAERFAYLTLAACVLAALVGLPVRYGKQDFDPLVWEVSGQEVGDFEIYFAFDGMGGVLGHYRCKEEGNQTVAFKKVTEAPILGEEPASLRVWAQEVSCRTRRAIPDFDEFSSELGLGEG